jgi:hypothetical protein
MAVTEEQHTPNLLQSRALIGANFTTLGRIPRGRGREIRPGGAGGRGSSRGVVWVQRDFHPLVEVPAAGA